MSPRPAAPGPAPLGGASLVGVVLAGGRGSRLGGVAKADLRRDGATLLEVALAACADCADVVVVGDPPSRPPRRVPGAGEVRWMREEPAYGGPVAALLTGVAALDPLPDGAAVLVLGVDMPRVDARTVARLRAAAAGSDGAVLADATGRTHLALVVRRSALSRVTPAPEEWPGMALRRLLDGLRLAPVLALDGEEDDVDTWDDAQRLGVERKG